MCHVPRYEMYALDANFYTSTSTLKTERKAHGTRGIADENEFVEIVAKP